MRKILATVLAIMMTVVLFTACGGGDGAPAPTPAGDEAAGDEVADDETPAPTGDVIELSMWHYFGVNGQEIIDELTTRFNEENPGIRITPTFVSRDDLLRQYTMGAVSGDLPDIGMVDNPDHASFSVMGVFDDITDLVDAWGEKDAFFEGPMLSATWEGRVHGLPIASNCLALFYNVDLLEEAGVDVPTTWDELEAAAAILTEGDRFGLAISMVNDEEGTFQFMPWFISADGSIDDLSGPGPIRAISFINDLIEQGSVSRDVINWGQGDANMQFMNGLAAMQVNGPWNIPTIEREAPDLNWNVSLIPRDVRYASVLGGENFGICVNSTDREAAFAFLSWFHSAETLAEWNERNGTFPPRSDALVLRDLWTEDPILSVFGEALQYAMPRGPHPRWPEISSAISSAMHEVFTGTSSPEEAMHRAAERYAELVAE